MVKKMILDLREDLAFANRTNTNLYRQRRELRKENSDLRAEIDKLKSDEAARGHAAASSTPRADHMVDHTSDSSTSDTSTSDASTSDTSASDTSTTQNAKPRHKPTLIYPTKPKDPSKNSYDDVGPANDYLEQFEGKKGYIMFEPQERSYRQLRNENAALNGQVRT